MERLMSSTRNSPRRANQEKENVPVGPAKYSPNYKYFQKKTRNSFMDRKAKLRDSYGDAVDLVKKPE